MRAAHTLLASLLLAGVAHAQTPSALSTRSLTEQPFVVPADLPATPTILIIGFTKASWAQTSEWSKRISADAALSRAATQYSVAVIEDVPKLLRGYVVDTMRGDLPASMHARFLVATEQSAAWKAWTRHAAPDAAYVLLLDAGRRTLWRGEGAVTDGQLGALKAAAR